MRARKTVTRQTAITVIEPRRPYVHARRSKLDHLTEAEPEIQRVRVIVFDHGYQGRRENRREAWVREIVGGRHDNTAGLVRSVQEVVKRRKELRLCRAEA